MAVHTLNVLIVSILSFLLLVANKEHYVQAVLPKERLHFLKTLLITY